MAIKDITGNRYGRLVAVRFSHSHQKNAYWVFQCDCGVVITKMACVVVRNEAKSCGCLRKEVTSRLNLTHGQARSGNPTRLYRIWSQMKRRCDLPTVESYPRYGGRGIRVCDEWSNSFEAFEQWAKRNGYQDSLTIDRRNNDGHYEPDNCRWSNRRMQANNRSSNRWILYQDEEMTLAEFSRLVGIHPETIVYRLDRGWAIDEIINTPVQ